MRRPGFFIMSCCALALLSLTHSGCAYGSRERHLAMRDVGLRPEPGRGVPLSAALPPEGLFADGSWAFAGFPGFTALSPAD